LPGFAGGSCCQQLLRCRPRRGKFFLFMNRCVVILLAASLLSGCATWDHTQTPQQQAYTAALIQQSYFDQQLANQRNYQNSIAMLNQYRANIAAQQNLMNQIHMQGQLNYIQRGIARQNQMAVQNSILHPGRGW